MKISGRLLSEYLNIRTAVGEAMGKGEAPFKDHKSQDAVVRNFEIIGEAVKNISDQYKNDHPEIPWKSMAGMRDKLIHHYFGVNFDVVWGVIKNDLRKVLNEIQALL